MTRNDVVKAGGTLFQWLLQNAGALGILGVGLWMLVKPAITVQAQDFIEKEVKRQVPIVVAAQVEKRFQKLEEATKQAQQDRESIKATQKTLIYQQGEVNKKLPELEGKLNTIIDLLKDRPPR